MTTAFLGVNLAGRDPRSFRVVRRTSYPATGTSNPEPFRMWSPVAVSVPLGMGSFWERTWGGVRPRGHLPHTMNSFTTGWGGLIPLPLREVCSPSLTKSLQYFSYLGDRLGVRHLLPSLPSSSLSGILLTASKIYWLCQLFDHFLWLNVCIVPVSEKATPVPSVPAQ